MIFGEEQTKTNTQRNHKSRAQQQWTENTRFMKYLWIPLPQNNFLIINNQHTSMTLLTQALRTLSQDKD